MITKETVLLEGVIFVTWAIFQLFYGENKLHVHDMMIKMISDLYKINYMLSWIFIVLAQWNNNPRLLSDTLIFS
jgi:hypothetical protein